MFDFNFISLLQTALSLLGALLAILLVILVHELGHFSVARWCGIKIQRFSIGFGKVLWKRKDKQGTEYTVCLLPLGGYVKMLGEGSEAVVVSDRTFAFNQKSLWARAAVVLAGPLVNFIFAIFLFWIVLQIGVEHVRPVIGQVATSSIAANAGLGAGDELKQVGSIKIQGWQSVLMALIFHLGDQDHLPVVVQTQQSVKTYQLALHDWVVNQDNPLLLESLGITPYQPKIPPIVAAVEPNSPAASLNLKAGDRIVGVNHKSMNDWIEITRFLQTHPDQSIVLGVQQGSAVRWQKVNLSHFKIAPNKIVGYLGVRVQAPEWPAEMKQWRQYSAWSALPAAIQQTRDLTFFNLVVLLKMLSAKISLHNLSGPISIFTTAGNAFKIGLTAYLSFIAFVSISLGFINLLPIPCLDGGHLMFFLVEGVRGRPLAERYQRLLMRIGLLCIVLLMTQAIINDLLRL